MERLQTDFLCKDARHLMRCLHVNRIRRVFISRTPDLRAKQQVMNTAFASLCSKLKLDPARKEGAALLYQKIAFLFAGLTAPGQPYADKGNLEIWSLCLQRDFCSRHLQADSVALPSVQVIVRFYYGIGDGTCCVERGFCTIRAYIQEHLGGTTDVEAIEDFMMVHGANLKPSDIASKGEGHFLRLGETGLESATLWRYVYGARLGIYRKGSQHKIKPACFKAIKHGILKAAGLSLQSNPKRKAPIMHSESSGIVDIRTAILGPAAGGDFAGSDRSQFWNNKFCSMCLSSLFCPE